MPFEILITHFFLLFAQVASDVAEGIRLPMGLIDTIILSSSTGHLRLCLRRHILDLVDPHKDAQLKDHGVLASETFTQAEASWTAIGEVGDIMRAEINRQTLAMIDTVRIEVCTAMSATHTEINAIISNLRTEINASITKLQTMSFLQVGIPSILN